MSDGPLVGFGELLIRLSPPGRQLLLQTPVLETWLGGAEANVVGALARLGHPTSFISAVPDGPLGDAAVAHLRIAGVDCTGIRRSPGRMGLYWVENGAGLRPTQILYDRAHSSFATLPAAAWDWDALLRGAARLHLSGITPALGANGTDAALAAAAAAAERGIPISFDGNYRRSLWESWDGRPQESLRSLIEHADILLGDHRDIALVLGRRFADDPRRRAREAAEAAFAAFPKLELIASTTRHSISVDHHRLSARIDCRDHHVETPEIDIPSIVDRIGTGDAFAAGVLHAHMAGTAPDGMAATGLALALFKHSVPGDATPIRQSDLDRIIAGGFDIRR